MPLGRRHDHTVLSAPFPDFSVKPTLTGQWVVLRPFALEQDAPALRQTLRDPETLRLTGSHSFAEIPEWDDTAGAKFLSWYSTRNKQSDRLDLAVIDKGSGQCVGEVVLNEWAEGNRSCSFRTAIGPPGKTAASARRLCE